MTRTPARIDVVDQQDTTLPEVLDATCAAAAAGDFDQALIHARRVINDAEHLQHSVVREALAADLNWWQVGDLLNLHPQAAFDAYAHLADTPRAPARQRPHLAVVCTAGLAVEHDMLGEHGINLDDLDAQHSLAGDPTVVQLRAAAQLLGDDIWIAVKLPGAYDGDDHLDDDAAIRRWTTVVLYPDELSWLREALTLNAEDPADADDDLEPRG